MIELASQTRSEHKGAAMRQVIRYHPLLVMLHWVLAALIVGQLMIGFGLVGTPNADPGKIAVLGIHMVAGIVVLALMVVRFVTRLVTSRPPDATSGSRVLDRAASLSHWTFYALILLIVGTGFATALATGLPEIVFERSGRPLPPTFATYPTFVAHGVLAVLLSGLIVFHLAAALYHHFGRMDRLFQRMTFGERGANDASPDE